MSDQKICKDKELELQAYKSRKLNEIVIEKAYGGYECKLEAGKLVHFKYWVSKKLQFNTAIGQCDKAEYVQKQGWVTPVISICVQPFLFD